MHPCLGTTLLLVAFLFTHLHATVALDNWHHPKAHPAHALFNRQDRPNFPVVGSSDWGKGYPNSGSKDVSSFVPQEWRDALAAAVTLGRIPNIPISKSVASAPPTYPGGLSPASIEVCSSSSQCRHPTDIVDAPAGVNGLSFDDGPTQFSAELYDFLEANDQQATHFMIGRNILESPGEFLRAFELGNPIAGHGWSHRQMTTLSNEEILGELGFTLRIVYESTGGRLFKYFRPPYGDADNRVRAIAREVFGLTAVLWNQNTNDWTLKQKGGTTLKEIDKKMTTWLSGPKDPGLNILHHETSIGAVAAFIKAYPLMVSQGWINIPITDVVGSSWQNAVDSESGDVVPARVGQSIATPVVSDAVPVISGGAASSAMSPEASRLGQQSSKGVRRVMRGEGCSWVVFASVLGLGWLV